MFDAYAERVNEFKKTHPDFDELVKANGNIPMHTDVQIAIASRENGPCITYFLAQNPELAKSLAKMQPLFALVEIGVLSAKLEEV